MSFIIKKFIKGSSEGFKTIIADALEAVIGAIYIDKGIDEATDFVLKWIIYPNLESGKFMKDTNYKGQLLEFAHSAGLSMPLYRLCAGGGA